MRTVIRDDQGTSLIELMVGMVLMAIFGSMFTGAVVMMNSAMNKSQAVSLTSSQLNTAFLALDKAAPCDAALPGSHATCGLRYASAISPPGTGATGDWYVEFRTTNNLNSGSEICTQLRIDSQQLQQRTWSVTNTVVSTPTGWVPIASGITNGGAPSGTSQPFLLVPTLIASNVNFQQLTINLASLQAGSGVTQTSGLTTVTFTALNSTLPVPAAPICQEQTRP